MRSKNKNKKKASLQERLLIQEDGIPIPPVRDSFKRSNTRNGDPFFISLVAIWRLQSIS